LEGGKKAFIKMLFLLSGNYLSAWREGVSLILASKENNLQEKCANILRSIWNSHSLLYDFIFFGFQQGRRNSQPNIRGQNFEYPFFNRAICKFISMIRIPPWPSLP
jgi:hypothetical protein